MIEAAGGTAEGANGGGATGFAAGGAGSSTAASSLGLASSRLGDGTDATDVARMRGFGASGARPIGDAIAANAAGSQGVGSLAGPAMGGCTAAGFSGSPVGGNGFGGGGFSSAAASQGGPGPSIAARLGLTGAQQNGSPLGIFGDPCASSASGGGGNIAMGGMRFDGTLDGAMRFGFSSSLSDMTKAAANADAAKLADAGLSLSGGGAGSSRARPNPFDIWVEGKVASFSDSRAQADLTGHFGLFSVGADYVLNPNLLVGTMVQFDSMQQRSNSQQTDVRGQGWLAGPYATLRLSDNVFLQARGAWGRSSNFVSPFLTYTDSFETERWLVSSTLTGRWRSGAWSFRPPASVSYMEDVARSYADTYGIVIPSVKSTLGQAKAGPEIGYRFDLGHTVIEPHAGVQVIYNFAPVVSQR